MLAFVEQLKPIYIYYTIFLHNVNAFFDCFFYNILRKFCFLAFLDTFCGFILYTITFVVMMFGYNKQKTEKKFVIYIANNQKDFWQNYA